MKTYREERKVLNGHKKANLQGIRGKADEVEIPGG